MHRQNLVLLSYLYTKPFELVIELVFHYSSVPGHRNWKIETEAWNLAGFLHFFKKPAGSDLGSFSLIYRNFSMRKSLGKT